MVHVERLNEKTPFIWGCDSLTYGIIPQKSRRGLVECKDTLGRTAPLPLLEVKSYCQQIR